MTDVRPEEHPATGVRRAQCPHGDEHHLEGEEGDPLDWAADQLGSGVPEPTGDGLAVVVGGSGEVVRGGGGVWLVARD